MGEKMENQPNIVKQNHRREEKLWTEIKFSNCCISVSCSYSSCCSKLNSRFKWRIPKYVHFWFCERISIHSKI